MTPEILSVRRRCLKFTQPELGEALGVAGNTIARWERGEAFPSPLMLHKALICVELEAMLGSEAFAALCAQLPTDPDSLPLRIRKPQIKSKE